MSMFCYQCQETARKTGCTVKGVCGKNEEVSNIQDLLIYVTKGISQIVVTPRYRGLFDSGSEPQSVHQSFHDHHKCQLRRRGHREADREDARAA